MYHLEVVLLQKRGNSGNCTAHSNISYHPWIHKQNNHDPHQNCSEMIIAQFKERCIHYFICEPTKGTIDSLCLSPSKWYLPVRQNKIALLLDFLIYFCFLQKYDSMLQPISYLRNRGGGQNPAWGWVLVWGNLDWLRGDDSYSNTTLLKNTPYFVFFHFKMSNLKEAMWSCFWNCSMSNEGNLPNKDWEGCVGSPRLAIKQSDWLTKSNPSNPSITSMIFQSLFTHINVQTCTNS